MSPMPDGFTAAYLYITTGLPSRCATRSTSSPASPSRPIRRQRSPFPGSATTSSPRATPAWLLDPARNSDLAGSIRAGSILTIEGTSDKGIRVVETFSLSGATAASRAIESC